MATQKLFYENVYQTTFTAQVRSCTPGKHGYDVVLDQTCFYPEGGGQPWDTGTLNGVRVTEVHERGGEVVHCCEAPLEGDVTGCVDWDRRFDLMQQHSGEHIVSGLIHARYGYENVGFHMGAQTITIDLSGPMDETALREIEAAANAYLWKNIPVEISWPDPEALAQIPYRSKKELTGAVRIVTFPGADCCACCGLHVTRTGEIGLIKLLSCQKFHDGVRIEMLSGGRALAYCSQVMEQNTQVSRFLSAKPLATAAAVERLQQEAAAAAYRLVGVENQLFTQVAAQYAGQPRVLHITEALSGDALRRLTVAIARQSGGVVAVCAGADDAGYQYCLSGEAPALRTLVQAWNTALHGRGGGKGGFAQGSVQARKDEIAAFWAKG